MVLLILLFLRLLNVAVRSEDDTVARLKILAERKGMGYQTLLKAFVHERLYEEKKLGDVVGQP